MTESYLYQKITEEIRQRIMDGTLKPGERVQSMRELCQVWNCTPGTIQRAFLELVQEGLLVSQPGRGTRVAGMLPTATGQNQLTIRRATMVNQAEAFLLERITAGFSLNEIETSIEIAMDRWRSTTAHSPISTPGKLMFCGSHDLVVNDLAHTYFGKIEKNVVLDLEYAGSLGGLFALAGGKADIAGSHLWDEGEGEYNLPHIQRVIPGKQLVVVTLAQRRQGLIVAAGNPLNIHALDDLAGRVRFVNRQQGSGTRVWLDHRLKQIYLSPDSIKGYSHECLNHSELAREIAEERADVGIGLESAARAFGLEFIFLNLERYDLVMLEQTYHQQVVKKMFNWLSSARGKTFIAEHAGYDNSLTGKTVYLETS